MAEMSEQPSRAPDDLASTSIPLVGARLEEIRVGYSVRLEFGDAGGVLIQTRFTCTIGGVSTEVDPETDLSGAGPLLGAIHTSVVAAFADEHGALHLKFGSEIQVTVEPHQKYEAWEFSSTTLKIVSVPGGDLAVFKM